MRFRSHRRYVSKRAEQAQVLDQESWARRPLNQSPLTIWMTCLSFRNHLCKIGMILLSPRIWKWLNEMHSLHYNASICQLNVNLNSSKKSLKNVIQLFYYGCYKVNLEGRVHIELFTDFYRKSHWILYLKTLKMEWLQPISAFKSTQTISEEFLQNWLKTPKCWILLFFT